MPETQRRHFLSQKETTQLFEEFSKKLGIDIRKLFGDETTVETAQTQTAKIFFINHQPLLAVWKNVLMPTLLFQEALQLLPKIVVNMGAVPHVCNGADIMAPGVVQIEKEYKLNDHVVITDERHGKPLAVAAALTDSATARILKHGKIAKNMHHVGDDLWNELKKTAV
jgi:PUA domain protein